MREKVSIYITIPGLYKTYNFLVPDTMKIDTMKKLVCSILQQKERLHLSVPHCQLLHGEEGTIIPASFTVDSAGISNGTVLFLIKGDMYGEYSN